MPSNFVKNLPRVSIILSVIFLLSTTLFSYNKILGLSLALSSNVLYDPQNWYQFFTYPLVTFEFKMWFLNSVALLLMGWVIEKRVSIKFLLVLIAISIILSGLSYAILNARNSNSLSSFGNIGWTYMGLLPIIGRFYWKSFHWAEKVIAILYSVWLVLTYFALYESPDLFFTFLLATNLPAIILFFKLMGRKKT